MPYIVIKSDGTTLTTIQDNTVDNTTNLTLIGNHYSGYGQYWATNFVRMLENAANTTAPSAPLRGQLWYNTTTSAMNVWSGTAWTALGSGTSNTLVVSVPSTGNTSTGISVTGTYTGALLTGIATAVWNGTGGGSGAISNVSVNSTNNTFSCTVAAPASAGTYTLTLTGSGNTASGTSGNIALTVLVTNTITLTSVPGTASLAGTINVSGGFTGITPLGISATWNPGNNTAAVTNFTTPTGSTWTATVASPPVGTYTLTVAVVNPGTNTASGSAGNSTTVAASYTGPGDIVGSATAWYGLRAYSGAIAAAATQALLKARRDSDDATADILVATNGGFGVTANASAGSNGVSASSWAASANLYVVTWYDQSGNSLHVTQATAGLQNYLHLTGDPSGTKPAIIWNGTSTGLGANHAGELVSTGNTPNTSQPMTISVVMNRSGGFAGDACILALNSANVILEWRDSANIFLYAGGGGTPDFPVTNSTWHAMQFVANGGTSSTYIDGTSATISGDVGSNAMGAGHISIGGRGNATFIPGGASMVEVGLWPVGYTSPNKSSMDLNQRGYWGLIAAPNSISATIPGSAFSNSPVTISGTYTGSAPSGLTAVTWDGTGGGSVTPTGFSATGGTFTASVTSPATAGSYTLSMTGTGLNTTSTTTGSINITLVSNAIAITSIPASTGFAFATNVSGTFTGTTPGGLSAKWTGNIDGAVSNFAINGNAWSAKVVSPSVAASYTLVVTGTSVNTASSAASTSVAVAANALAISPISTPTNTSTGISVSGTYAGGIPTNLTGVWNPGSLSAGVLSNFGASGGAWSAIVTTPSAANTYNLTVTGQTGGPNTVTSAQSNGVVMTVGAGAIVHSFVMTNWNAAATSPGFVRVGIPFKKGDIPSGATAQIKLGASTISAQFDERVTWSDGSLKFAVCHFRDTTFSTSESRTYDVWRIPTTSFVNTGNKALSDITGGHDFKVVFTNLAEKTDTGQPTAVGSGTFNASFNTHMAVATRIEKHHSGAVCEGWNGWGMAVDNTGGAPDAHLKSNWYADIWKNSDGSVYAIEVAAVLAQDWWSVANKQKRFYNADFKDGSTTLQTYANVAHPYKCQWITCQNSGGNNRGKRFWVGGAQPTLTYKPDRRYWISTGLMPPYDLAVNYTSTYGSSSLNAVYVPCGNADHRGNIDDTGAYAGRGLFSNIDAIAFLRQTPEDMAAARINGHAGLGVFIHYRSNQTRTRPGDGSADIANTPHSMVLAISDSSHLPYDFTADGMPAPAHSVTGGSPGTLNNNYVSPQGDGSIALGGVWAYNTNDASHAVNYSGGMYLFEGERYHLEAAVDHAMNCIHQLNGIYDDCPLPGYYNLEPREYGNVPATSYGAIAGLGLEQIRSNAWSLNLNGFASGILPDNHIAKNCMVRFFKQQTRYLHDWIAHTPPDMIAAGCPMNNADLFGWGSFQLSFCTQGALHAYHYTEDTDARDFGFVTANMAVNLISDGNYSSGMYYVNPKNDRGWAYKPGNSFGKPVSQYSTHIKARLAIWADTVAGSSTIHFWAPLSDSSVNYPSGTWPANNDVIYIGGQSNATFPPELAVATPYYIVNAQVPDGTSKPGVGLYGTRGQLATSQGGSPITFTATCQMDVDAFFGDWGNVHPVQVNPPGIDSADSYTGICTASLIMAYASGYSAATLALVNKQITFMSPVNRTAWASWSYAPPT